MALTDAARQRIETRLAFLDEAGDRLVIDGDTHASDPDLIPADMQARMDTDPNYFHGKPATISDLLADMDQAGVDASLCWQNPSVTRYGDDQDANFAALLAANHYICRISDDHPRRILAAGWTDPKMLGLDRALELVRVCVEELGFPVVKMNPAQNAYPIDSPEVERLVERIVELGAVPAFHFGGDTPYTPPEGLAKIAASVPHSPVIGVHMGGGGSHFVEGDPVYIEAREIGLKHPNIFYIMSAQRDTHLENGVIAYADAGEPFRSNLALGSDLPYGRPSWVFGGFRGLSSALKDGSHHPDRRLQANPTLIDDAMIQGILGGNLARLYRETDRRLLGKS